MIIRTVLTVSRCGMQMPLQSLSLVLIFSNTERQLQLKKNLYRNADIEKYIFYFNSCCSSPLQFAWFVSHSWSRIF